MTPVLDAGCVFLLTDYGDADEFAGLLRAVVARAAPGAPVVDLTHNIAPFDVAAGARALERCAAHLGPGIVVGVVDPGVGSDRRPVALGVPDGPGPRALVGPDNGLLVPAAEALGGPTAAVVLPPPVGATTFDGRDVFAPAAARLWRGDALPSVGTPVDPDSLVRLPAPHRVVGPGRVEAEVLWIDRFGNAQLAAGPADADAAGLGGALEVRTASGREVPVRRVRAFAELAAGAGRVPLAAAAAGAAGAAGPGRVPPVAGAPGGRAPVGLVVDANGRLALCCDRRPAAGVLGLAVGDVVVVHDAGTAPPAGSTQ